MLELFAFLLIAGGATYAKRLIISHHPMTEVLVATTGIFARMVPQFIIIAFIFVLFLGISANVSLVLSRS